MLNPDDIAIIFRPIKDENGEWTGGIDVGLAANIQEDSAMHPMHHAHVYSMAAATAAAMTAMGRDEELEDKLLDLAEEVAPNYMQDFLAQLIPEQETATHVTREGNIYTLNFHTPTEGNA